MSIDEDSWADEETPPLPPLEIAKRELHLFYLLDCSGSMEGSKISTLNTAIEESIANLETVMLGHPEVEVKVRAISFQSVASWHIGPEPEDLRAGIWRRVSAGGLTATGAAVRLLGEALDEKKMARRGLPPVCVLVSDGAHTDGAEYDRAINNLRSLPWGKRAVRVAIGIGDGFDDAALLKFVSHPEYGVLSATRPEKLQDYIQWASVSAVVSASVVKSKAGDTHGSQNVALAPPPTYEQGDDDSDVW